MQISPFGFARLPSMGTRKSTKGANGFGSVWSYVLKDGRRLWAVQLPNVRDLDTGRVHRPTKRGFSTQSEAEEWRLDHARSARRGTYRKPSKTTLGDYLDKHLEALDVRATTRDGYRRKIDNHIRPHLGSRPLAEITRQDLERLYRTLRTKGRTDHKAGAGLSPASVRQVHAILSGAFSEAERDGLIPNNPCRHARMPARGMAAELGHEMQVWEAPTLRRFLDITASERHGMLWRFLAMTGARRGEALALRWSDLDLDTEHPTVTIARSLGLAANETGPKVLHLTPTKTGRKRRVYLDAATVAALKAWKARQTAERLVAGPRWTDPLEGRLVFARDAVRLAPSETAGGYLHPERVSRLFLSAVQRHGMPPIRLHDLRHTWATLALASGVEVKTVQEHLGHSTPVITLTTYAHVLGSQRQQAADRVAALLG
jgi:integrase